MKTFRRITALILIACMMILTGCEQKEAANPALEKWNEAQALLYQKDYTGAADAFEALGAYENASLYAVYSRALSALQTGEYENAYLSFDMLGDFLDSGFAAKYAKALHLTVLSEEDSECLLYATELFEQIPLYKDSLLRAENARKGLYDAASALLNAGDFALSEHYFALLEDYSDSALMEKYVFAAAKEAQGTENLSEYLLAVEAFESLSGFKDSAERAENILKTVYGTAEALFEAGKYDEAEEIFTLLSDPHRFSWGSEGRSAYSDSKSMADYCAAHALWASDRDNTETLLAAAEAFESLNGFGESSANALEIREKVYGMAVESLNAKEFDSAISLFEAQKAYSDSESMIQYAAACAFEEENMQTDAGILQAAAAFEALNGFKDSAARAEALRNTVYAKAEDALEKENYAEAAALFALQDTNDGECMAQYTAARALEDTSDSNDQTKIEAAKAYEALGDFRDCAERAAALRESVYQNAENALANDSYFAALRLYALQDYKDSRHMEAYVRAAALEFSGEKGQAANAFESLGEFRDSRSRSAHLRNDVYESAVKALAENDFDTAISLFASQSYLDSKEMIPYAKALQLEYEGNPTQAAEAYEALGDFKESASRAETLRTGVYEKAVKALADNDFDTAVSLFASQDYKDSADMIPYARALQLEYEGNPTQAAEALEALGDFKESASRAETLRTGVYEKAVKALSENDFDTAISLFASQNYLDSFEMVAYVKAIRLEYENDDIGAAVEFEKLSGFRDSAARAAEIRERVYLQSLSLFEKGKLSEAKEMFALQTEYRDCAQMCAYISGLLLEADGKLFSANEQYASIPGFMDTEDRIQKNLALSYNLAWNQFEMGEYENAAKALEQLGNYKDCVQGVKYVRAAALLENAGAEAGIYANAKAEFSALGDYRDSKAYIETIDKLLFLRFVDEISVFSENGLAAFRKNGKWGFIDTQGNVVVNAQYDQVYAYSDGLAAVKLAGKWGFIDESGQTVIQRKYDLVRPFSCGMAMVATKSGSRYTYAFVNKSGKENGLTWSHSGVISADYRDNYVYVSYLGGTYDKAGKLVSKTPLSFSDGMSPFTTYANYSYLYGYIDENGRIISEAQWQNAYPFENGFAIVQKDEKYGLLDKTGEIVIACKYDKVFLPEADICRVLLNGKYGYVSTSGKTVSAVQWDYAYDYSDQLALVWKNGYYGYIGTLGETKIPFVWDEAKPFENGCAAVKQYGAWQFIDVGGTTVLTLPKSVADVQGNYKDPLIAVKNSKGMYGFLNHSGTLTKDYIYDQVFPFKDGLSKVKKNGYYGFVNENGTEIVKCSFSLAQDFSCGVAWVQERSYSNFYLIDRTGKKIYTGNTYYDDMVYPFADGVTFVYEHNNGTRYFIMDTKGKKLTDAVYSEIHGEMTSNEEYTEEMAAYYAEIGMPDYATGTRTVSIPSLISSGIFPSDTRFTVSETGRILTCSGIKTHSVFAKNIDGVWYLLDENNQIRV